MVIYSIVCCRTYTYRDLINKAQGGRKQEKQHAHARFHCHGDSHSGCRYYYVRHTCRMSNVVFSTCFKLSQNLQDFLQIKPLSSINEKFICIIIYYIRGSCSFRWLVTTIFGGWLPQYLGVGYHNICSYSESRRCE